ncbi:UDP-2-acetamido-2-deoxy-ribo-hexuluronate aminotransferase [Dysgonomonadaceae bacterium PH5-43]|nr:UDP-2-acetamido-2-deoxy-ribo-hexuluronate aminotransferase [Dysgonomonadaceae bacterium PH5-43]
MKKIQMVDLTTQYENIKKEMDEAIIGVVQSGQYINGGAVKEFADELATFTGAKFAIPCANGTDALQIALMSLNLLPGDEVIVPAFTYAATAEVIGLLRLTPVLVDVSPLSFNIDTNKIEEAISPKTKAIIVVHLFGQCVDMEPVLDIAEKYNLRVIEDNAQSIGSVYTFSDGTKAQAGTMGDIGTLSFFPSKNLGCYGDGGAILTNNEELAASLKMIASHGQAKKYIHQVIGCNSRLDTLQAAILKTKLPYLNNYIEKRQKAAHSYNTGLRLLTDIIEVPFNMENSTHVYHQYTLKIKDGKRDELQAHLAKYNIPTMIYYPLPLHKQPAFKDIVRLGGELTVAETLCDSVLSIPIHTELESEQLFYIIEKIATYE